LELLLDAEQVSSQRLHQLGVLNRVTMPGTTLDAALQWANKISQGPQRASPRIASNN
jgi:enoyl-CoA hydratase/carnithine racemase